MILDFIQTKAWSAPALTAPIMWWAGTTTVANIGTTTTDLWGTYTSDGWSPITATWFVLYPAGNPSTIIWGSWVTDFPDGTLPSPITASATWLTAWSNYCFKPYAINAIGTSYGTELCFTTDAGNKFWYVAENTNNWFAKINLVTWVKLASYTPAWLTWPRAVYQTKSGQYLIVTWMSSNNIMIFDTTNLVTPLYTIAWWVEPNWVTEDGLWNIYVASRSWQQVRKISLSTWIITWTFSSTSRMHYIAYANWKLYAWAYISDWSVKVINPTTMTLITSISIWWDIYELWASDNWQYVYWAAFTSGNVFRINTATDTLAWSVSVSSVLWIWVKWNTRVVASTNTWNIVIIDAVAMTVVANLPTPWNFFSAAYWWLMDRYYVSDRTWTTIKVIDAVTNTLLANITWIISPWEFTS